MCSYVRSRKRELNPPLVRYSSYVDNNFCIIFFGIRKNINEIRSAKIERRNGPIPLNCRSLNSLISSASFLDGESPVNRILDERSVAFQVRRDAILNEKEEEPPASEFLPGK